MKTQQPTIKVYFRARSRAQREVYSPEANRESHDDFKRAKISPSVTCFSFSFLTWPWYFFKRSWLLSLLSLLCSMLWGRAACHRIAKRRDPPPKIMILGVSDLWFNDLMWPHSAAGTSQSVVNESWSGEGIMEIRWRKQMKQDLLYMAFSLISGPWNDPYMRAKICLMKENSMHVWKINSRPRILLMR